MGNNTGYTTEQLALYHTTVAARRFIELGQYDVAAAIMLAGADGFETKKLSSIQDEVTTQ